MKAQCYEVGGRILLDDNTGGGAVTLRSSDYGVSHFGIKTAFFFIHIQLNM
jgi:hypothetical protein